MKVYRVSESRVWVNSVAGNVLMVGMLAWAIWAKLQGQADWKVNTLLLALPIILLSALVGNHQPTSVEVTPESITFSGLGRRHTYPLDSIKDLVVKRYFMGDRYLVQIGDFSLFRGRYWIPSHMEGHKELMAFLQAKQAEIRKK